MTKDDLRYIIGMNIKRYRIERNLTQEELAEKVGISTSFCANIERGKKGISTFALLNFADALGVTANQLMYEQTVDQQIENIAKLLQRKSKTYLNWLEQVVSIPDSDFISSNN